MTHWSNLTAKATAITESGKKIELFILQPSVYIDQSYEDGTIPNLVTSEICYNSNQNSTINSLRSFQTKPLSWCSLVCTAVECFKHNNKTCLSLNKHNTGNKYQLIYLNTHTVTEDHNINNSNIMYEL